VPAGTYIDIPMYQAHSCGKLVTAPAWPAHPAWLARCLKVLGTHIEREFAGSRM
jgi:protease I